MDERIQGMTTCPINKGALRDVGYPLTGHTELLAQGTNSAPVVMMLVARGAEGGLGDHPFAPEGCPRLDHAGTGAADPWSLIEAIILVSEMAEGKGKHVDKSAQLIYEVL
jgi:4-hydroxy-L-threonine phosphate dehydrogenase PdxA